MLVKRGIDLIIDSNMNEENHIISIKSFPVGIYNNFPYRKKLIHDLKFFYSKENFSLDDFRSFITNHLNDIKGNDKCIIYVQEQSKEHALLRDTDFNDNIHFHGFKIKREKIKTFNQELKERIELETKNDDLYQNAIFFEMDLSTDELFKTNEMFIHRYENYKDYTSSENASFSNNYFMHSTEKQRHDWFIEIVKPHIIEALKENKNVYFFAKSFHTPYIASLNNELKSEGYNKVLPRRKNKPKDKVKKELSYKRIKKHMLDKYDELLSFENHNVLYCDGATFNHNSENGRQVNGSAFFFYEEGKEVDKQCIFCGKRNIHQAEAEVYALNNAIDYIIENNKTDKLNYFVFDSDTAFTILKSVEDDTPERFPVQTSELCFDIYHKIKKHNIKTDGLVVKSHQKLFQSEKHPVIKNNEAVDMYLKNQYYQEYLRNLENKNKRRP